MKIAFTVTVDVEGNNIKVDPESISKSVNNTIENASKSVNDSVDLSNVNIPEHITTIGERLPKGRYSTLPRPRTDEYPYNVADVKKELQDNSVTIGELARVMGNFPVATLRNIFRYDNRRFTKEEYNVILKCIDEIKKSREI